MTRDEWQRAEPIVTQALLLPEPDRKALIDTAFLEDALRRELLDALHHTSGVVAVGATGSSRGTAAIALPRLVTLTSGEAIDNGRFVVIRQIGRGGMGSVYLAHDTMLGTLVALKALPFDERLLAEARRAAVCSDHPHVATIHNILRTEVGGEPVGLLVMEYVAGTPASRLLDDGPVDVGRVLRWGRQVASAIAHAHDHQVLHCDLKPANIVITPDGRAKVLDFGIARATFDSFNPSEPVRGTVPYMAPEQLMAGDFSQAGDIYSLGVTLFELLSGRRPFDGDDAKLRLQIMLAPPPALTELVAGIPLELQSVVERALAKEPENRFRSARSFERALEAVETGVHHTTASIPIPVVAPAPVSAWSQVALGLVAVITVLVGVATLGAYTSATYNLTLERAGFANESPLDWLNWGLRASGGPLVLTIITLVVGAAIRAVWRLAHRVSGPMRRIDVAVRRGLATVRARLGIDEVMAMSAVALVVSITTLAAAVTLFWEFFPALVSFAASGSAEKLAMLSPDYKDLHNDYRRVFALAIIVSVAAWYPALKTPERRRLVPNGLVIGGVILVLAALVLLHHPHRLMFSENAGDGVEVVRWQEQTCYALGQRGSDTLVLCPELSPPRHRIVRTGDAKLEPVGIRESVFRGFYRVVERNRKQSGGR